MSSPLADRLRPQVIEDVVGQQHLLGEGKILNRIIKSGNIPNMIFFGPSGIGKTTVAKIIAKSCNKKLYKLNGTNCGISDIKDIVSELSSFEGVSGVVLYLDEIQYLNKKQQQSLLEYIENGQITLIASTTENPYFYIYNAILSRCTVFEFKPLSHNDVKIAVDRAFSICKNEENITVEDGVSEHIAKTCGGDVRKSLNAVELCVLASKCKNNIITLEDAMTVSQKSSMKYDRDSDQHYDILSAFQKSIRGSDENAAIHYLARLVEAGDIMSPCRRLLVIAAEDIGLSYPQAITIVKSCVDAAVQLGLPEARIPLAEAVIFLCTCPKSNSAICAIDDALSDIKNIGAGEIPDTLRDSHYSGAEKLGRGISYQYPHMFKNHYVKQQYLPDLLKTRIYYKYGDNKIEQATKQYWDKIK